MFLTQLAQNPIIAKELRGRMRGKRAFGMITAYLGLISLIISIIYYLLLQESSSYYWDPESRQYVGKVIFGSVVLLQLLLVSFIGPALTAGAITSEREKQTFDLIRTTLLSSRDLVLGKLGSALAFLFLLIFTALPIESLAFILGGVGLGELLVSILMLIITAILFCSLGLFFSSYNKRTLNSTVSSYASILLSFLLKVVFVFILISLFDSYFMRDYLSDFNYELLMNILTVITWIMVSTNPLLSAIVTEVILIEEQSFFITTTIGDGYWLPSPWILFVIIYLGMSILLISRSIRLVNRRDR